MNFYIYKGRLYHSLEVLLAALFHIKRITTCICRRLHSTCMVSNKKSIEGTCLLCLVNLFIVFKYRKHFINLFQRVQMSREMTQQNCEVEITKALIDKNELLSEVKSIMILAILRSYN